MKSGILKRSTYYFTFLALTALMNVGCSRENGDLGTKATASFTLAPVPVNKYISFAKHLAKCLCLSVG
jgi:hypothetical protein